MLLGSTLQVPRLVAPMATNCAIAIEVDFASIRHGLEEHVAAAVAKLDTVRLGLAYSRLERLCQQYARDALLELKLAAARATLSDPREI